MSPLYREFGFSVVNNISRYKEKWIDGIQTFIPENGVEGEIGKSTGSEVKACTEASRVACVTFLIEGRKKRTPNFCRKVHTLIGFRDADY
jgi:hypothetical protein